MDKKYKWGIGIALTAIAAAAAYHFWGKKKQPAPAENQGGGGGGGGGGAMPPITPQQVVQYQPPVIVMPITTRYEGVRRRRIETPVTQMQAPTTNSSGQATQTTPSGNTAVVAANPNAPQLMAADDGVYRDCMKTTF